MEVVQRQRSFPKELRGTFRRIFERARDKASRRGMDIYGGNAKTHKILKLRGTGLRIELIERDLYHDYAGEDYQENTIWIYLGGKLVFHAYVGYSYYGSLEEYIPGTWESKILKTHC